MKKVLLTVLILISYLSVAQVGIGTSSPDASAALEISSTNKGMLIPRLTNDQIITILNPTKGLVVYSTDEDCIILFNGSNWLNSCTNEIILHDRNQNASFSPTGNQSNGLLGSSIALSDDGKTVAIGAPGEGTVHVYSRNAGIWSFAQILVASSGQGGDLFGNSVDLSADGNTIIVGSPGNDTPGNDAGVAYIFQFNPTFGAWTEMATLVPNVSQDGAEFGETVCINDNGQKVAVGSPNRSSGGKTSNGAIYIFRSDDGSWSEEFAAAGLDDYARYGQAIDISGDGNKIAGGSRINNSVGILQYNQTTVTWDVQVNFSADDTEASDQFGYSVSLSSDGSTLAVGAPFKESGGVSAAGAAYIFRFNPYSQGWSQQAILYTSIADTGDRIGGLVSLSTNGNTVAVAARNSDASGPANVGAVFVFQFNPNSSIWTEEDILYPNSGLLINFGTSLSISGDGTIIAVGDKNQYVGGNSHVGAAYIFD